MSPHRIRTSERSHKKFKIVELEVAIPDLPQEFNDYRILQLSDLHFGSYNKPEFIKQAFDCANAQNPDLVLITGDLIQNGGSGIAHFLGTRVHPKRFGWLEYRRGVRRLAKELGELLQEIKTSDGIYACYGNHEYLEGLHTIRRQLSNSLKWLNNDISYIKRGSHYLHLGATDDSLRGSPSICRALGENLSTNGHGTPFFHLLLSHNPDITLSSERELLKKFDLILCGHTHGGQIRLPFYGPIITPN